MLRKFFSISLGKFVLNLFLLFVLPFYCSLAVVYAETIIWDGGGGDNSWYTSTNWSSDRIPTSTDDVIIDGNTTVAVNPNSPPISFNSLTLGGTSNPTLKIFTTIASGGWITIKNKATLEQATLDELVVSSITIESGGLTR